jgi:alcohol dehydrogenase
VCANQTQPGFTHHGSYAELVVLHDAEANLIAIPDDMDAGGAALLGCRFATAYRGLIDQARLSEASTVIVVGCGGVGLSAVMIAAAVGARVIGVDVDAAPLDRARTAGASEVVAIHGLAPDAAAAAVAAVSGPVTVSLDSTGRPDAIDLALRTLQARGTHVQIGLVERDPVVRVSRIIAKELAFVGSHGMARSSYGDLLRLVSSGRLRPQDLVTRTIGLDDVPGAMAAMRDRAAPAGVTMIRPQR